jgi:hypothetical protein
MELSSLEITDIRSLIAAIKYANDKFNHQVWWRGQRDFAWSLTPSIFRKTDGYDEHAGILRFQQRAISRHLNLPHLRDRAGWLFLMQHYRLPTRLLDWTESPLVAAFFGSEIYECHTRHPNVIDDSDGALFALSPYLLNYNQIQTKGLIMPEEPIALAAMAPAFDQAVNNEEVILAVRPAEVDIRLMVQLSEFTLSGYEIPIDEVESDGEFVIKYRISKKSKPQLLKDLKEMGIRLSTIFPDLDHLSDEIRRLKFMNEEAPVSSPNHEGHPNWRTNFWGHSISSRGSEPST